VHYSTFLSEATDLSISAVGFYS